jgi:hypothetical protein
MEHHAGMVEHVLAEVAVRREAGIVHVVDVVAAQATVYRLELS